MLIFEFKKKNKWGTIIDVYDAYTHRDAIFVVYYVYFDLNEV